MQPEEVERFLDSGAWRIDPQRCKTLRACSDLLGRLPDDVLELIVNGRKIILFAPQASRVALVAPYCSTWHVAASGQGVIAVDGRAIEGGGDSAEITILEHRVCWIYVSPSLENYSYPMILAALIETVAYAFLRVIATGAEIDLKGEGWKAIRQATDVRSIAERWGFEREIEVLRRRENKPNCSRPN